MKTDFCLKAIMQHEENTLRHHFQVWLGKTREIMHTNDGCIKATIKYRKILLQRSVASWKEFTQESLQRLVETFFVPLFQLLRCFESKRCLLPSFYRQTFCRTFSETPASCDLKRLPNTLIWVSTFPKSSSVAIIIRYPRFILCKSVFVCIIPSKRDEKRAVAYYEQRLVASGWLAWRQYITTCRVKNEKYEMACQHHQSVIIKKCFSAWRKHHLKVGFN